MSNNKWTVEMVEERMEEAVRTLKRVRVPGLKPKGYFNTWPEIIYTTWELEMQEKLPLRLGPPPAAQISRMEEVLGWLWWLEPEERNLVWLRAKRVPWKPLCQMFGYGRTRLWQKWNDALTKITDRLNK